MRICPKCGRETRDDALFCGYCGTKLKGENDTGTCGSAIGAEAGAAGPAEERDAEAAGGDGAKISEAAGADRAAGGRTGKLVAVIAAAVVVVGVGAFAVTRLSGGAETENETADIQEAAQGEEEDSEVSSESEVDTEEDATEEEETDGDLLVMQEIEADYWDDLMELVQVLSEDVSVIGVKDWLGEDFRAVAAVLEDRVVWELEDGTFLAVYPISAFRAGIYYGEMEDGQRSGEGIWYLSSDQTDEEDRETGAWYSVNYVYDGEWESDYPNGTGTTYQFSDRVNADSGERETAVLQIQIGFTDGYIDGTGTLRYSTPDIDGECTVQADQGYWVDLYGDGSEEGTVAYASMTSEDGSSGMIFRTSADVRIFVWNAYAEDESAEKESGEEIQDTASSEEETAEDSPEQLTFDTSVTIEETVIYDAGGIRITAVRLDYTDETVDLVFRVENGTGGTINLLNGSAGSGDPYKITVNGRYVFQSDSLQMYSEAEIPAGETVERELSISREELKWSGITAIAEIETTLWLADEMGIDLEGTDDIALDLRTSVADTYNIEEDGFVQKVLSQSAQSTYGYQVLESSTEETVYDGNYGMQATVSAAALIEEDDGTIHLLVESQAHSYYRPYVHFYVNGVLTDSTWDNTGGSNIDFEGEERCVLIFTLDPSGRVEYGIDEVTSAKVVLSGEYGSEGLTEGDFVVELTVDGAE